MAQYICMRTAFSSSQNLFILKGVVLIHFEKQLPLHLFQYNRKSAQPKSVKIIRQREMYHYRATFGVFNNELSKFIGGNL